MKSVLFFMAVALMASPSFAGNLEVKMEASKFVMVNAPAMSCISATGTNPSLDIWPLSLDLGKMSLNWTPSSPQKTLKVIYMSVSYDSPGLAINKQMSTIAGQDLNCIMRGSMDGSSALTPNEANFPFAFELLQGGFQAADSTLKTSFSGKGHVLVYALEHENGQQDIPLTAEISFDFQFGAIQ